MTLINYTLTELDEGGWTQHPHASECLPIISGYMFLKTHTKKYSNGFSNALIKD